MGLPIDPISAGLAGVEALTGIATAVAGIKDMNKRRETEMMIAKMSYADQKKLNEKLLKSKTTTDRMGLLVSEVSKIQAAKVTAAGQDKWRNIAIIGLALTFLVVVIVVTRKK